MNHDSWDMTKNPKNFNLRRRPNHVSNPCLRWILCEEDKGLSIDMLTFIITFLFYEKNDFYDSEEKREKKY